ncbi:MULTISPECIES: hypothetical protein [unclassified Vibrio]|uniref:Phage tail protein n=1 Tax=Vibrio sp. HB236076 TaxID=3232307 RepID=A0AB39H929_9VIBR|nr:hypothetical protein [Vibrio sp. HB161653]MDP5253372.1 hypothetical protein [Vibrio sp. HB161653]
MSKGLLAVSLSFNGQDSLSAIESEMVSLFGEVGAAYKKKTNHSIKVIKDALKEANQVIYKECLVKAPVIRPAILARESKATRDIHIGDPRYMVERSSHGKKWLKDGIVARRIVTFKSPVSSYAAALEYGRGEFLQVVRKAPYGITKGETDFWLRKVGAMEAQPFLLPSQRNKADKAMVVFASSLSSRWLKVLKKLERKGKI